jgi:HAD superfamily hydrolase (TIGR01509 family)
MIKALIFDLDGTLVNTEMLHYRAWKKTLLKNGVRHFSFETFLHYVGTSNEKVATDYIAGDGIKKSVVELIREKQSIYIDLIPEIRLCEGVHEILARNQGKRVMAVASSSHQREVVEILEVQGIAEYFAEVIGGDMVENKKPDPEIYLKTQAALDVSPDQCLAFEDSSHGLNAAKNAGMFGIAIPNEFTRNHDFSRADYVLESFAEVTDDLLGALLRG